jgi:hypothetical protein
MISFLFLPAFADNLSTIRLYADIRERYENHQNPTFYGDAGKNIQNLYSRWRVGADYQSNGKLSGRLEYQNASDVFWTQNGNASTDNSDLLLGYLKYSTGDITGIGGRQKIELGQQRLIGSTEWLNLSRSFDAGRVQSGQWDAWAGRLGVANNKPETARIEALSHTDKNWGTTSFIAKHDLGSLSTIDIQALDHFAAHTFGKTMVDVEGVVENGSSNGKDLRAWAWHVRASQPILPKTTLRLEANAASGGGNATTTRTFDNLYPSNHDLYGLADLVGWKNMNDYAIKIENRSFKSLTLSAEAHAFSLRDASDGWYNAVGAINAGPNGPFKDGTGASGRNLGSEYDLLASYDLKKCGTLSAGIALFDPAAFQLSVAGVGTNRMLFGYVQYGIRF